MRTFSHLFSASEKEKRLVWNNEAPNASTETLTSIETDVDPTIDLSDYKVFERVNQEVAAINVSTELAASEIAQASTNANEQGVDLNQVEGFEMPIDTNGDDSADETQSPVEVEKENNEELSESEVFDNEPLAERLAQQWTNELGNSLQECGYTDTTVTREPNSQSYTITCSEAQANAIATHAKTHGLNPETTATEDGKVTVQCTIQGYDVARGFYGPSTVEKSEPADAAAETTEAAAPASAPLPEAAATIVAGAATGAAEAVPANNKAAEQKPAETPATDEKAPESTPEKPEESPSDRAERIQEEVKKVLEEIEAKEGKTSEEQQETEKSQEKQNGQEKSESKESESEKDQRKRLFAEVRGDGKDMKQRTVGEVRQEKTERIDARTHKHNVEISALKDTLSEKREEDSVDSVEATKQIEKVIAEKETALQEEQKKIQQDIALLETMNEETSKLAKQSEDRLASMGLEFISLGKQELGQHTAETRVTNDQSLGFAIHISDALVHQLLLNGEVSRDDMKSLTNDNPSIALKALYKKLGEMRAIAKAEQGKK